MIEQLDSYVFERIRQGAKFRVDFESRSLWLNGKRVIDHGEYDQEKFILTQGSYSTNFILECAENLYSRYYNSLPSERNDHKRKRYFLALDERELSDNDMLYGESREVAQGELEIFILLRLMDGSLKWNDEWGKWYWQSTNYPTFIILRQWIEPNF